MIRAQGSTVFASPEQIVQKSVSLAHADRRGRVSVAGNMPRAELGGLVERTCGLLRDGGVLVVQLVRPGDERIVRAALGARNLTIVASLFDLTAGCLVSFTVERTAMRAAMAKAS